MTVIHIVLFKFKAAVSQSHKSTFIAQLKALRMLPCVHNNLLFVGGPSITTPIEKSQGYEISLVSFHPDADALAAITSTYLWPYKEDVVRFDFEVPAEDEEALRGLARLWVKDTNA
ncbi:hypothetical protein S7711_02303 [Stachybotrys chartarum IBT 7711]|uniref:Stress-response A/B barrel domain-containing protein n=1 Tax=Stachybotrys chartarum (strain CBS 109288 / IBT 7711) TaxID=1280523 RepID=A0A084B0W3_STACB|nr:hypothetical protein S7711_02303 [Stachybotrys chartarum IBT 7711]